MDSRTRNRALYVGEVFVILFAMLLAALGSALIVDLVLLPALILGAVGAVRPSFFARRELADPRRGLRWYLHACGGVSAAWLAWGSLVLLVFGRR